MPFRDFLPSRRKGRARDIGGQLAAWFDADKKRSRRRRRKDLDDGGILVEPNKPKNLSGGAAAALEFDDEAKT